MKSISIERNSLLYALLLACFCCLATLCTSQTLEISKSYINVSKATTGGSIEKGDILEIRACIAVRAGFFDSCAFYDAVPLGTDYVPGSLRVITNEGKLYKQFTDAANDDCGSITGTTIRMHLGFGNLNAATAYTRGRIASNHKPSLFGSACIMIAAYRVLVTADANNTINTGGGSFTYQSGLNPVQTFSFSANTVRVYPDFGMCTNNTWSNYMTAETNGTFGSGRPRNRTSQSATVPGNYVWISNRQ